MSKRDQEEFDPAVESDVRVKTTKTIWVFSVAMMGISIPLSGVTHSALIPLCILATTAISTATVWLSKGMGSSPKPSLPASGVTQEQFNALQERLESVETISSFERTLHERRMSEALPVERASERAPERVAERIPERSSSMRETA